MADTDEIDRLRSERDEWRRRAEVAEAIAAERLARAEAAEQALVGQNPSADVFREASAAAVASLDPPADLHASSEYRRKVGAVLVRRALETAALHASGRS